ncbi:hypothetical protein HanRHA438_Chr02g0088741 [Helianthus annuus]|nr:hypothetical protein HanIR_Chr02g0090311 [Helianthus annuus]KAJ0940911.1 hypothetical protein HanRHA438_Chr02g0088741 [Helianthus annuus]
MSKKLDFSKPKFTLRKFGIKFLLMQKFENTTKVFLMVSLALRVDKDVVNKGDDEFIQIRLADTIHEIHECGWCIGEPKRHHQELVMSITSPKRCLVYVFLLDLQLVIARPQVDLRKIACSLQLIEQIVDPG